MPKPRTVTVPLYDGDDFEHITDLRQAVIVAERNLAELKERAAEASASASLRAGDEAPDLGPAEQAVARAKAAFDAFVHEAAERAEMWVLQPIGHHEYADLLSAHPARTVTKKVIGEDGVEREVESPDPRDAGFAVNTSDFGRALLMYVDPDDDDIRTIIEPEFGSEAERRKRIKRLSAGEFDTLWIKAMGINSGMVVDPKAMLYSTPIPDSPAT